MKIVEPSFEILSMPDGEEALALLERIGRIAYKSEDRIDSGEEECSECNGWRERFVGQKCEKCNGTGKIQAREPSSHKFIRMILKAERKARLIKNTKGDLADLIKAGLEAGNYKDVAHLMDEGSERIVSNILDYMKENPAHESVIEHCQATVYFISNRGYTHELCRHRISSITQESTRYCDYNKGKFGSQISVIDRKLSPELQEKVQVGWRAEWEQAMKDAEYHYQTLRKMGLPPELARDVLPQALKAEVGFTANFREWTHVFKLRCSRAAHPDMRRIMIPLQDEFRSRVPIIFD